MLRYYCNLERICVRQFNRTISVLDGIIVLKVVAHDLNLKTQPSSKPWNASQVAAMTAYSLKRNNQMKLTSQTVCQFTNTILRDYYHLFEKTTNFPKIGECKVLPKTCYVKNHVLNSDTIPLYLLTGLWRLSIVVSTVAGGNSLFYVNLYFKVQIAGYFKGATFTKRLDMVNWVVYIDVLKHATAIGTVTRRVNNELYDEVNYDGSTLFEVR
ncbi:uncharacterized protein LOC135702918 [Ochlerotatus camptorhynchus]|uniref:uncharacterized protein LOC135702918 n=1 Tax=Ochlerotatus camptorhynchus TaxID=644619 RepID=UPI0031E20F16